MHGRLEGKVVMVTGGGSGFGEGICRRLAEDGARVVVLDINDEGGQRVAHDIVEESARFVHSDVSRRDDLAAAIRATVEVHGRIDAFVNNAGITHRNQPMLDVDESWFDRIFAVNVKAIYYSALELVPVYRRQGGGVIVNIASTAGLRPRPGLTVYNASKGAAIALTKSMAIEFAPDNIRVNAICPVAGETPLLGEFMGGDTPEARAKFAGSVPLGRLSTPRDIANSVAFLVSDEAEFLTGVALEVDGGRCISSSTSRLVGRTDQDLVDVDVRGLRDAERDDLRDVLALKLAHLAGPGVRRVLHRGIGDVIAKLRLDDAGFDDRDADVVALHLRP